MPNLLNDNIHYVKFMRGSMAAWEALKSTPEKISNDTLYFIYQNAQTSKDGKLYLGQKLISGTGNNYTGDININDIGDVYIDNETLADKQILVYNDTSQQWENATLSQIINTAIGIMQGASSNTAGTSGLVPVPLAGDQNKFLKGDGTWSNVNIPTFDTEIFNLNDNEVTLNGFNSAPTGSVPIKTNNGIEWSTSLTGSLNREITTLEKIQAQLNGSDPEPLNTNTIYMVPNSNSTGSDRYQEYMMIDDNLELLGTFGEVNLTDYVTINTFNNTVGTLNNNIDNLSLRVTTIENNYVTQSQIGDLNDLILSEDNSTLVEEVNTLSDRLKWHDLSL